MAVPSKFQTKGGTYFGGRAAAALTQCYCVMWNTVQTLALATTGNNICGVASNDYLTGEVAAIVHGGESLVALTGTAVAGDYVKVSSTPGVLEADGTSGATAISLATVGKLTTSKDADSLAWCDFEMGR